MPEATIDEHREVLWAEHEVGCSHHVLVVQPVAPNAGIEGVTASCGLSTERRLIRGSLDDRSLLGRYQPDTVPHQDARLTRLSVGLAR
jgi:hypothetical protein